MIDIKATLLDSITSNIQSWGKENIRDTWDNILMKRRIKSKYDKLLETKHYQREFEKQGFNEGFDLINLIEWLKDKTTINYMMGIYTSSDVDLASSKDKMYQRAYYEARIDENRTEYIVKMQKQNAKWIVDFILEFVHEVFWQELPKEYKITITVLCEKANHIAKENLKEHKKTQEQAEEIQRQIIESKNLMASLVSNMEDPREMLKSLPLTIKRGLLLNLSVQELAGFSKRLNISITILIDKDIDEYINVLSQSQIEDLYKLIPPKTINKWIINYKKESVVSKEFFKGFKNTNLYLHEYISGFSNKETFKDMHSSSLDKYLLSILKIILNIEKFEILDIEKLLVEIQKHHNSTPTFVLVKKRWTNIIYQYFTDNLPTKEELISLLENIKQVAMHQPDWIYSDVLIDFRTIEHNINLYENIMFSELMQKPINELTNKICYPQIDRELREFYSELDQLDVKRTLESIYTVNYGDAMFYLTKHIINALALAVIYGSFTHLILICDHILSLSFKLFEKYPGENNLAQNLYRQMFLIEKNQRYLKTLFSYVHNRCSIQVSEAEKIYKLSDNLPLGVKKIKTKALIFGYLGYYFSDNFYASVEKDISSFVEQFINNYNAYYATALIESIEKNAFRIDINIIIRLCDGAISNNYSRHANEISKVVVSTIHDNRKKNNIEKIIGLASKYLSNTDFNEHAQINNIIVALGYRFKNSMESEKIVNIINGFNIDDYFINSKTAKVTIAKCLPTAKDRIEKAKQNNGNLFIGYSLNPFRNINLAIQYGIDDLPSSYVVQVVSDIVEVLFLKYAYAEWKIDTLKLLTIIFERYGNENEVISQIVFNVIRSDDKILESMSDNMSENFYTINNLNLTYYLFKTIVEDKKYPYEISKILVETEFSDKYNQTNLKLLNWFIKTNKFQNDKVYFDIILHHLYKSIESERYELKYATVNNMFLDPFISNANIQNLIINVFEHTPSSDIRFLIANKTYLLTVNEDTQEFIKTIKDKAQYDSNFCVRNVAEYFDSEIEV